MGMAQRCFCRPWTSVDDAMFNVSSDEYGEYDVDYDQKEPKKKEKK